MFRQGLSYLKNILLGLMLLSLVGCSVNPVTGKQELSLMSEQWELQTGAKQYFPLRQAQGGDYVVDPRVEAYVREVGEKLAAVSDRQLPYEFNVINSSVPNAWALPGGKVSINRGLLIALKSEAELAAVLAHEIVHAAARHGAQSAQRSALLQSAMAATAIVARGEDYAQMVQMGAGLGAQLVSTKYGRDAERESDHYGIEYMVRAGYDPQGAVALQQTFVAMAAEQKSGWLQGLFASHPASQERLENNRQLAANYPPGGRIGQDRYQQVMAYLLDKAPAYDAYQQAQQAMEDKNLQQARSLVQRAIRLEPKEGHFQALAGDIHYRQAEYSQAQKNYDQAISLNTDFFYYYLRRGLTHQQLHEFAAAAQDLERSNTLLPTAAAYNGLGDLARAQGQLVEAKAYYAKVADQQGPAGQAAYASLVELDMPSNPSAYLQVTNGTDSQGRWIITISNPTPLPVRQLTLQVRYPNLKGQVQQLQSQLDQVIKPGQAIQLSTGLYIDSNRLGAYDSQVVAAELAK